jgi:hypothetical protein
MNGKMPRTQHVTAQQIIADIHGYIRLKECEYEYMHVDISYYQAILQIQIVCRFKILSVLCIAFTSCFGDSSLTTEIKQRNPLNVIYHSIKSLRYVIVK